jgi:hypothetical protein
VNLPETATLEQALAFYDSLAPVQLADLRGRWRGSEIATGHPMNGLLVRLGWYGKSFASDEDVQALLFRSADGTVTAVDPALVPLGFFARHPSLMHVPLVATVFPLYRALATAHAPTARLRMMEHRGVVTATMIYDAKPIMDSFRRVDEDTLLGLMDYRELPEPFFFVLRRDVVAMNQTPSML